MIFLTMKMNNSSLGIASSAVVGVRLAFSYVASTNNKQNAPNGACCLLEFHFYKQVSPTENFSLRC